MDNLRVAARDYWTLRNAGELGETRTRAHNVLLDEMTRCKIEYEDREDAAQIAGEMIEEKRMAIKAIETRYNGYRFRSRLEARWAVFFDTLNIKYEYESEGFDLKELGWYLPDFWLPVHNALVEIKPVAPTTIEETKLLYATAGYQTDPLPLFLIGTPGEESVLVYCYDCKESSGGDHWKEEFYWHFTDGGQVKFWLDNEIFSDGSVRREYLHSDSYKPMNKDFQSTSFGKLYQTPQAAYRAARSARFEHGETPTP